MNRIHRVRTIAVSLIACLAVAVSIPIMAAPPAVGSVQITPDPAYFDTPLTAIPSDDWYDADGDPTGFKWIWQKWDTATSTFLDIIDTETSEPITTNTLAAVHFTVGDQVKVICTPFDGTELGTSVEDTIVISAGAVVISPKPATTASKLTATPVHWLNMVSFGYQWQKWDIATSNWLDITGAITPTLDSSNFVLNDQIKIICTPFDGTAYGAPVEDTIEIAIISYDTGVEIKPGDGEGIVPINLKSQGVTPLTIYTTEGFDATTVEIETLKLGPAEAAPVRFAYEDSDLDGDTDLVLHFRTRDLGLTAEDTEVVLNWGTIEGTSFTATMSIRIVPEHNEAEKGEEIDPEQHQNDGQGRDTAPGLNKEPGQSATGKGKNK